ncbi:MAG: transposase, partial [Nitrososphaerota archaeon]|nr:transposase [Nitrososphaerota archaeon]
MGWVFSEYVKYCLVPVMKSGDILVFDNFSVHKVMGVLDPLVELGVKIVFLPVYSPDLNPIELLWSKMKTILRKLKAKTHEECQKALQLAMNSITRIDIKNWFAHNETIQYQ